MQTSMSEMRALAFVAASAPRAMPAFDFDSAGIRSSDEYTSAKVIYDGPDRRVSERRDSRPHDGEVQALLSVVYDIGGARRWNLRDSRTSHEITGFDNRVDLDFAILYLKRRNARITCTQTFYQWDQA